MISLPDDPGVGDRLLMCNLSHPTHPESPQTHNCVLPYFLFHERVTPYTVIIYGHVTLAIIAVTLVTNGITCFVLTRRHMRNTTNFILVAMAISDTLTGVVPLPALVRFFTLGGCYDWVPYEWCLPYIFLTDHVPTVFHTASVWLTVLLALQRYVYIRYGEFAKRYCHTRNTFWVIVVIYLCAIIMQIPRLAELQFTPLPVQSLLPSHHTVVGCYFDFSPSVRSNVHLHFNLYYWFRIVFCHLVPCSLLVGLNFRLGCTIRRSKHQHERLTRESSWGPKPRRDCVRFGDGNAATLMLVVVVGLAVVVEVPLACFVLVVVFENTLDVAVMGTRTLGTVTALLNLFIVLGYPVNFFIYCAMSRQFRTTLADLIRRREVASPSTPRSVMASRDGVT